MMQQVASNKPDSAASALPLDISRGSRTNDNSPGSFNQVFRQESSRPSAFEEARKNAADRPSVNAATVQKDKPINRESTGSVHNDAGDANNVREPHSKNSTSKRSDIESSGKQGQTVDKSVDKNNKAEQNRINDKPSTRANDAPKHEKQESKLASDDLSNDASKTVISDTNDDDFDYITYVSELALLGNTGALKNIDAVEQSQAAITSIIAISPDENSGQQAPLTSADLAAQSTDNMDDLLQLGIDKAQLQIILDAQNAQLDLNAELSDAEQLKLQTIIANMLNTLQPESKQSSLDHESLAKVKKADQALLEQLLLHPAKSEQVGQYKTGQQSGLPIEQYPQDINNRLVGIENAAKTPKLVKNHEHVVAPNAIPDEVTNKETNKEALGKVLVPDAKVKIDVDPAVELKISDKDVWRKTPELQDISKLPDNTLKTNAVKTDTIKTALDNMALLNDEQSKLAVNSLQERVQSVVVDLKTDGKGNEFIAALQSGVKEFKQQLAQGREPGINLKDIVTEALNAAGVDVDKSVQAKVDNSVSQFNAVLNLANAVNYSASQQQAQVLGITDNQLAKEINHQQIEGTKIANANATSANNQAMLDKAINIYKAEGQAQLAEKVRWMVNAKNSSAEIRLDPPDLGAVNIKVNLSGDAAQVNFTVQSAAAKEALDQAVPRLRDMLQQQGIELGQSSVQQDSQGQQGAEQQGEFAQGGQNSGSAFINNESNAQMSQEFAPGHQEQRVTNGSLGGIDYYA